MKIIIFWQNHENSSWILAHFLLLLRPAYITFFKTGWWNSNSQKLFLVGLRGLQDISNPAKRPCKVLYKYFCPQIGLLKCRISEKAIKRKVKSGFLASPLIVFSDTLDLSSWEHAHMTSDGFEVFLTYQLTCPNQIRYYIILFSKIRCSLTYIPTYLKIWRHMWMLPKTISSSKYWSFKSWLYILQP